jgi:hypothetical protein
VDVPSLNRASVLIADDRASGRYRLLLEARARRAETAGMDVTLHDLSQTGLLFESDATLDRYAEIMLDISGIGPVAAFVIWTNGAFYGAEFGKPLNPEHLKAALAASKIVWPHFAEPDAVDLEQIRAKRAPEPEIQPRASYVSPIAVGRSDEGRHQAWGVQHCGDDDRKLPLAVRVWIIAGLTLALWSGIFALLWLALG